jgi:hypothetical protein
LTCCWPLFSGTITVMSAVLLMMMLSCHPSICAELVDDRSIVGFGHSALTVDGPSSGGGRVECKDCVFETMQGNATLHVSPATSHAACLPACPSHVYTITKASNQHVGPPQLLGCWQITHHIVDGGHALVTGSKSRLQPYCT